MPPVGIEPTISAGGAAADLHLRLRGHWDRHLHNKLYKMHGTYIKKINEITFTGDNPTRTIICMGSVNESNHQ